MTEMPLTPAEPGAKPDSIEVFAAHVAHDFNNLLTGILGNLELMQNRARRNGHEEYGSYIDGARSAGLRAAAFAQRLLALSGRHAGDPVPTDLSQIANALAAQLRADGHDIEIDMADLTVSCDPNEAELVLGELLENAVAATAAGGQIMLWGRHAPDHIVFAVRDTGAGMSPELLARACQPFFTTRPNGTGHGLGLAIASRFAQSLGGTLSLVSARDEGTTATITLPRNDL